MNKIHKPSNHMCNTPTRQEDFMICSILIFNNLFLRSTIRR